MFPFDDVIMNTVALDATVPDISGASLAVMPDKRTLVIYEERFQLPTLSQKPEIIDNANILLPFLE